MKRILILVMFMISSMTIWSQIEESRLDVSLESTEDYKAHESFVIECVDWLQETPLNSEEELRQDITGFLMRWLVGSPTVSIELHEGLVPINCPECLMIFMGGWAKHSLENETINDKVEANIAGINQVIEFYTSNRDYLKKDSDIEKFIKLKKRDKLRAFVVSKLE